MDMMYVSTRDAGEKATASQAILKGLAADGGLFVPEQLPGLGHFPENLRHGGGFHNEILGTLRQKQSSSPPPGGWMSVCQGHLFLQCGSL